MPLNRCPLFVPADDRSPVCGSARANRFDKDPMYNICNYLGLLTLAVTFACTLENTGGDTGTAADTTGGPTGGDTGTTVATTGSPTTGTTDAPTGGSETGQDAGGDAPCIDTPTVLALDEVSPGGFSAAELLLDKEGADKTILTFASEPTTLADEWKGRELPLTVAMVRAIGGAARWIDSEVDPDHDDSGKDGEGDEAEGCIDRLEVDVNLVFITNEHEFRESRDTVMTATSVERGRVELALVPPGLTGDLDLSTIYGQTDPPTTITGLWIHGVWDGDKAGGSVIHQVEIGGENGSVGVGALADWGDPLPP